MLGDVAQLVGEIQLARMEPPAHLINASCAQIVDQGALLKALRARTIVGTPQRSLGKASKFLLNAP